MEIQMQMANKYLDHSSTSKYSRQNRRLTFDQEEKFFALVRLKKYHQACDLAHELKQQGFVSSSITTFATYIQTNLLDKDMAQSEEEQLSSQTSSEGSSEGQSGENESSKEEGQRLRSEQELRGGKSKILVKKVWGPLKLKREVVSTKAREMKLMKCGKQQSFTLKDKQNKANFNSQPKREGKNLPLIKSSSQKMMGSLRDEVLTCGNMHKWKHNCKNQRCPNALKQKVSNKKLLQIR